MWNEGFAFFSISLEPGASSYKEKSSRRESDRRVLWPPSGLCTPTLFAAFPHLSSVLFPSSFSKKKGAREQSNRCIQNFSLSEWDKASGGGLMAFPDGGHFPNVFRVPPFLRGGAPEADIKSAEKVPCLALPRVRPGREKGGAERQGTGGRIREEAGSPQLTGVFSDPGFGFLSSLSKQNPGKIGRPPFTAGGALSPSPSLCPGVQDKARKTRKRGWKRPKEHGLGGN